MPAMVVMVVLERVNLPGLLRWKVERKAWQAEIHRKCIPDSLGIALASELAVQGGVRSRRTILDTGMPDNSPTNHLTQKVWLYKL